MNSLGKSFRENEGRLRDSSLSILLDMISVFLRAIFVESETEFRDIVYSDESLNRPPFSQKVLSKLLNIASEVIFMLYDELYCKTDGVAMRSHLGPSFTNFFYVDDIFTVFSDSQDIDPFLSHKNLLQPIIKFTVEHSENTFPHSKC